MRIGTDKWAHFGLSAFLTLALGRFVPLWLAASAVAVLGVAKELWDAKVDKYDLIADGVGIAVAVLLLII